jgi:hypothetical protein
MRPSRIFSSLRGALFRAISSSIVGGFGVSSMDYDDSILDAVRETPTGEKVK